MKVFLRIFFFLLFILLAILIFRTLTFKSQQIKGVKPIDKIAIPNEAKDHFTKLIQQPTVSYTDHLDTTAFQQQDSLLNAFYPLISKRLEKETINQYSMVYRWKGKDPSLKPVLLLGHLDVVPIEKDELSKWKKPPFSGELENGIIWGRGGLDDKINIIGTLEAVNLLLEEEFLPARDIYLAFGHDEETGGNLGAKAIAESFEQKGLQFEFVLDEGLVILKDALDGLNKPLAMIGVGEKGFTTLNLEISLEEGGHSAMPSSVTAIGNLSSAINRLTSKQFPAKIDGAVKGLFNAAGPEMQFLQRALFANLWITKGLIKSQLLKDPTSASLIRTTTAPTIINAGIKENVLPSKASATVNFRVLPGESTRSVLERVKKVVNDPLINIKVDESFISEPSKISSTESFGYRVLQKTTQEIYPDVIISPGLVIAVTDSRHYAKVSDNIYRFTPVIIDRKDLKGIHGNNENISLENFENAIRFYKRLIVNSCR